MQIASPLLVFANPASIAVGATATAIAPTACSVNE